MVLGHDDYGGRRADMDRLAIGLREDVAVYPRLEICDNGISVHHVGIGADSAKVFGQASELKRP